MVEQSQVFITHYSQAQTPKSFHQSTFYGEVKFRSLKLLISSLTGLFKDIKCKKDFIVHYLLFHNLKVSLFGHLIGQTSNENTDCLPWMKSA